MRYVLLAALALLAACATQSRNVPADADTHRLSGANDTCGNCVPPEIRAKEQAGDFCAKSGKVLDAARQTFDMGIGHHYTFTFACVSKSKS